MVNKITFVIDDKAYSELVSKEASHIFRQRFTKCGAPKFTFMTYDSETEITVDLSKISVISVTKATQQPREMPNEDV